MQRQDAKRGCRQREARLPSKHRASILPNVACVSRFHMLTRFSRVSVQLGSHSSTKKCTCKVNWSNCDGNSMVQPRALRLKAQKSDDELLRKSSLYDLRCTSL